MELSLKAIRIPIYTGVLTTLLVIPSLLDPFNVPKLWVLTIGAGICFSFFAPKLKQILNKRKLPILASIPFALALFSAAFFSPQSFYLTLVGTWGRNDGLLAYVSLLFIFFFTASVSAPKNSEFVIKTFIALGTLLTLYGFLQINGGDLVTWNNPAHQLLLTLGNSDFSGAFLGLTAIATFSSIIRTGFQFWKRAIFLLIFLAQFYLISHSHAVQGIIILMLGCAILIGLNLSFSSKTFHKRLGFLWWTFSGIALFVVGPKVPSLFGKVSSIKDRYYHWVAGMRMMQSHLLTGVGLDNYGNYYRQYRTVEAVQFRGTATTVTNNAHNVLIQLGATGGLPLLIGYLILVICISWRGVIALQRQRDKQLVGTLITIWIAFQAQSFVSIDQLGLTVWGWLLGGTIVGLSYLDSTTGNKKIKIETGTKQNQIKFSKFVPWIALGLIPSIFLTPTLRNELSLRNKIVDLVSSNSDPILKTNSERVFSESMNSSQLNLRLQSLNYLLQVKSNDVALRLALKTVSQFPNSFESWEALAVIYEGLGQKKNALKARRETVKLDPLNEEVKKLLTEDMSSN